MTTNIQFIDWLEGYRWACEVQLGTEDESYKFSVSWNSRDESYGVTIKTLTGETIISDRKMILGVDLLEHCFSEFKPDCVLMPLGNNALTGHITYESMINNEVKLYHITKETRA